MLKFGRIFFLQKFLLTKVIDLKVIDYLDLKTYTIEYLDNINSVLFFF